MTGRTNAGAGSAFAVIDVTYPEGAICTCTNGVRTMQAKDSSGHWMFLIPRAGDWTVTAESEGTSKSETVTIAESKAYTVDIKFTLTLYDCGLEYPEITGDWAVTSASGEKPNYCTIDKYTDYMLFTAYYHSNASFSHSKPIDISEYSTLHILGKFDNKSTGESWNAGVSTSNSGTGFNASVKMSGIDSGYIQRDVDVSQITGDVYFKVYMQNTCQFFVRKIWLE